MRGAALSGLRRFHLCKGWPLCRTRNLTPARNAVTSPSSRRFAFDMCQCAERRAVIIEARKQVAAGNMAAIGSATAFVVRSIGQDARSLQIAAVAAAKARLIGKR